MPGLRRGLLLPLLLLAATATPIARLSQAGTPRVIDVYAQRCEFWPSEIRVAEGETVEFRVRSDDTMHGFRIVGESVRLMVPKRGKGNAVATFTATRAGRYTIECTRLCGAGHNFMRASLVVTARAEGTR